MGTHKLKRSKAWGLAIGSKRKGLGLSETSTLEGPSLRDLSFRHADLRCLGFGDDSFKNLSFRGVSFKCISFMLIKKQALGSRP